MKSFLAFLLLILTLNTMTFAGEPLTSIPLKDIDGKAVSLKDYQGKVVLLVNVASQCGNTPQYKGLEETYQKYKDQGLVIVGVPTDDFGGQEPGTNEEIKTFCSTKYAVSFPLLDKIHVKGPNQHPLYQELTKKDGPFPGDVKWNFGKFLLDRQGKPIKRIEPGTKVSEKEVVTAIETALAEKAH